METIKEEILALSKQLKKLVSKLDLPKKEQEVKKLEEQTANPDFWKQEEKARKLSQRLADLKQDITQAKELTQRLESVKELTQLADKEKDNSVAKDLKNELRSIGKSIAKLEISTFLSGPHDRADAIVSIHSGQGGTEAMDWAAMLQRMYAKFFDNRGWKWQLASETPGEEAGIKSVTFLVHGKFAYGYMLGEAGTHRLVRQSPFNADNLRQTSFAKVEVMPVVEQAKEIKVKDEDIHFQAFRSSGKGGQNVNKVSTAVRLKHIPSGIVVESQTQRHQEQNRKIATQLLKAKLWQRQEEERKKEARQLKGENKLAGWGNQIRSYVLHPYKQVKDLRTNIVSKQPDKVLDGNLDEFIEAELKM